jgi:hypothetical protein
MTEPADLRAYQADAGLEVDGVRGPITRAALIADEMAMHISDLIGFRGSLGLIIQCEGYRGDPYLPPGFAGSGVTLDYGFDLGQQGKDEFRRLYGHLWTPAGVGALSTAIGLRGDEAGQWLAMHLPAHSKGKRWPITREQAAKILPRAAGPYWHAAVRACPALRDAPARVQTALLSVTYSAWTGWAQLARPFVEMKAWKTVAYLVSQEKGSKARREIEARLIESVGEGV